MSSVAWRSSGPLPVIGLLAAHLLSCAEEPVSFPSHPPSFRSRSSFPAVAVPVDQATLRKLAGPGARDCGAATRRDAAARVHRCASDAFARSEPFFCRFGSVRDPASLGPAEAAMLGPTAEGLVWAVPAAFVGRGSSIATVERRGELEPVLTDLLRLQPLHITSGMTRPIPAGGPVPLAPGDDVGGILIVGATIGRDGRSRDASLWKPIASEAANRAALDLVANSPFEPARLFGVPVDVLVPITLRAERGEVRFEAPSHAESQGAIAIEGQLPVAGASTVSSKARDDAERKRSFPATVFELGPGIRAPVAVSRGEPRISGGAMKCRGLVLLRAVIDETGSVVAVADLSRNPDAFTRAYADNMYEWTFRPATRDGVSVAVSYLIAAQIKCA